jgi:serine/threonine-protein kinase
MKQRLDGGPPVALAEVGGNLRGAAWAPGGTIVFSPTQTSGLRRMPDSGGAASELTSLDAKAAEVSHRWPEVLPGGRWVLYTVGVEETAYDEARLEAVSLETGERRPVVANASFGRFLPDGTLLFARAGMLFSVPFAPDEPAVHGEREVVVEGIQYDPRNGAAHLAVSGSGTVLYTSAAPVPPERRLAWLDPSGRISTLLEEPRRFGQPRLSPDGARLAVRIGPPAASDLWSLDIATSTLTRISHGLSPHRPVWHPDGRSLSAGRLSAGRWQLISLPASAAGASAVLHEGPSRMYPNDWSPDGRRLVFQERSPGAGWDLRLLEVDGAGQPAGPVRSIAATPFNEEGGAVSPDGALIAYELDEVDGVVHVYVRAFPDGEEKVQVSAAGARVPRWGRDGRLYYWSNGAREFYTAVVRLQGGRPAVVAAGKPLLPPGAGLTADRLMVTSLDGFDVAASGRLLVLEPPVVAAPPNSGRPVLALNWDGRRPRSPRTSP